MSSTYFLPRAEAKLLGWSTWFNQCINAAPLAFGITPAMAAAYDAKHQAFAAAYRESIAQLGSRAKIIAKNTAEAELRAAAREVAAIIRANPSVTTEQRARLGLSLRNPGGRNPLLPKPATKPDLRLRSVYPGHIQIWLRDLAYPTKRGKPPGVALASLYMFVGDAPPGNLAQWTLAANITRTKYMLKLSPTLPPATPVWLTACWRNARGEAGPIAEPVHTFTPCRLPSSSEPKTVNEPEESTSYRLAA